MTKPAAIVESDPEFLQEYGRVALLYTSAEFFLGQLFRTVQDKDGGPSEEKIKKMLKETFGTKVAFAKKHEILKETWDKLDEAVKIRNLIAHGIPIQGPQRIGIYHNGDYYRLDIEQLKIYSEKARTLLEKIYAEYQKMSSTSAKEGPLA